VRALDSHGVQIDPPNAEPRFSLSHLIEKLPKDTYDILEEISHRKNPLLDNYPACGRERFSKKINQLF
jgi:hypothetical protein